MAKKSVLFLIVVLVVAVVAVYFTFFYTKKCDSRGCFNLAMEKCSKVSFLDDAEDATWLYKIKGKSQDDCMVYVELVKIKKGSVEMLRLENKDMECLVPIGSVASPQDNLGNCHGLLKEEMQNMIIKKLHSYIVDNLGEISEELEKVV